MASVISENEVVSCPHCKTEIARLRKPFCFGQHFTLDLFDWIGEPYDYSDPTECYKCGELWGMSGYLHIKNKGWQPSPLKILNF